jgi:hypothetical protein
MTYGMINSLRNIGFIDDSNSAYSRLICQIGGYFFYANVATDVYSRPEIRIMGHISNKSVSWVLNEHLPIEVESPEQAIAWISWVLRDLPRYSESPCPAWIEEGKKYWHTLPWEREKAEYASRPRCIAQRNWVRVALKDLRERLESADDDSLVSFAFNGEVLTIRINTDLIAFPATGQAWDHEFHVRALKLRTFLPKRLMYREITFHVWQGYFKIEEYRYELIDINDQTTITDGKFLQNTSLH